MLKLLGYKMDTAVVEQFLNFFQDFIDLCRSETWPDDNTTEQELRNAFLMSHHIEKCLDRLQKKGIIDEFLSALNSHDDTSSNMIKSCLLDPPKYVLKKIINSNRKIQQMDVSFKLYLELFCEDKLEQSLTDLMVESASKETLLCNLNNDVQKDRLLQFRSEVLLSELNSCDMNIIEILRSCSEGTVELLVFCLLSNDPKYAEAVKLIKNMFRNVINNKDCTYRHFWKLLFKANDKYLIEMCVENSDIYELIVKSLVDCGKLLREGMSVDSFYIDLNVLELQTFVKRICSNDSLKSEFFSIANNYDTDVDYWKTML